jgi:hypothetical protein
MEVADEDHEHCHNFLRAAERSENSWRRREKAGEFGNHQGRRLLQSLSADLPSRSRSKTLERKRQAKVQ